jgi:hypothetical protein
MDTPHDYWDTSTTAYVCDLVSPEDVWSYGRKPYQVCPIWYLKGVKILVDKLNIPVRGSCRCYISQTQGRDF